MGVNQNFINLPSIASYKDNINIGDANHEATYTDVGPKTGLDVNVLNDSNSATTPTITNIVSVLANTEYSFTFPANTKRFRLGARGMARLRISFTSGQTSTNFITITPGSPIDQLGLDISGVTVYFESNKSNEIIEILSWV